MKVIIYSANINNYDLFHHPVEIDPNVKYMLFTDNIHFKSNIWDIVNANILNINHLSNVRKARCIKIKPHIFLPPHDISIWVDSCFKINIKDVSEMLKKINFLDKNIMCYKHISRDCIYHEASVCIKSKLDDVNIIQNQILKYEKENFPKKLGLFETGFMIRKNNPQVNKLNDLWWQEICNGSSRDQLSQLYVSWISNTKISPILIGSSVYDNQFISGKNNHVSKYIK